MKLYRFTSWCNENYINAQPGAVPGTTGTSGNAIGYYQIPVAHDLSQKQLRQRQSTNKKGKRIITPVDDIGYGYKDIIFYNKRRSGEVGLIPALDYDDNVTPYKKFKYTDKGYPLNLKFDNFENVIDYKPFKNIKNYKDTVINAIQDIQKS